MREIQASVITDTIERLCIEANQVLPDDIKKSIQACRASEDGRLPVEYSTTSSRTTRLQRMNRCQSVRIPEWHVYSSKSDRTYILQAETSPKQLMKASAEDTPTATSANP